MNNFKASVTKIIKAAMATFKNFPAANACALAFMIVTMVRIQLDWPYQEPYNFLFNCLHLALAVGVVSSLAAITGAQAWYNSRKAFLMANGFGIVAACIAFLALYFWGADRSSDYRLILNVSDIAAARVAVAILISLIAFIVFASHKKDESDFSRALFMTQKALFIAFIYGGVMMAGASGVAGAVETLLYKDMSSKVYMYIGAIVGFLAFTVFAGYFPDFRKDAVDEHRETAQKQPKFIEVLFVNIMVPILMALTVVLLAWSGKTIFTNDWPPFNQLASIAATYSVGGLWLHMMITRYETTLPKLYKRLYPITALLILAFEAWALLVQIGEYGVKYTEYYFVLVWVATVSACVLLMLMKSRSHVFIAGILAGFALISVLPVLGYQSLPIQLQVGRLETLLETNQILKDGKLSAVMTAVTDGDKEKITDAVLFLGYARDAKLPEWFDKDLTNDSVFKKKLGFNQTWPKYDGDKAVPGMTMGTYLNLPNEAIAVKGYDWALGMQNMVGSKGESSAVILGEKGKYVISWVMNGPGIPKLTITRDGVVVLEQNLETYLNQVAKNYPPGSKGAQQANLETMTYKVENSEVSVMLVFSNISIDMDPSRDTINYWVMLNTLYFKEK